MALALVTGAAGVMGRRLVTRLLKTGWQVRALVLPQDPLRARIESLGCELWEGDVTDAASLSGVCVGVHTVYHLAAVIISHDPSVFQRVNRAGTAHVVAQALRAGVEHFIYVSSASVVYPQRTNYAESKLEAERIVWSAPGLAYTIVRPTLVYEQGGGQELMMFLDYLRRFPIVPFIGAGGALKRPVWSEDVVDGLARLAGNARAYRKTYNFSGAERITMRDLAQLLLRHHGLKRLILPVPVPLCRLTARALGLVMKRPPLTVNAIAGVINHADLDPSEAMHDLGYHPLGVTEGFRRCFPTPGDALAREPEGQPTIRHSQVQKGPAT
jgi:nucleoside-diphosphate-sugar epimerase